ncbi:MULTISPECIES: FaeA/PapI family transcriptional regulator [Photorhabdus]|uniref:FaeA-like family protein n=2 Tax=Photorhabdus TaxID=29487 RepID=A0A5B0X3J6_9GAMM|nr:MULTISPECIES: FaeA/PapI family transcriptional regulator [Photorhabdus]KAA1193812.1 hypothetical protein F0L16_05995 [Photorhabdus heterorhabditis]KOY63958.1 hypothetical protein AM629_00500 [Photorhabdus heterorhabditis]MBS9440504.1 hypothetical protein [Photorhabdus heterorhabditis]NHB93134.1 hypothetical protein [Photorhabdus cinerea]NRN27161.1 hypothetical protein [Photorhabdus heterorhabditis subsp. aluminescens]
MENRKDSTQPSQIDQVLNVISKLCTVRKMQVAPPPESWPSTRDVAEQCNFTIYKARYLLLKLANKGLVMVTPSPVKNSLRWYISEDKIKPI